jgi:outer membrane lipoprotein SlyB
VARAMRGYASAAGAAGNAANWTREQAAAMKRWETQTISALKNVSAQEKAFERQQASVGAAQQRRLVAPHGVHGGHGGYIPGVDGAIVGGGLMHQAWEGVKSGADIQSEMVKNAAAGIPN